MGKVIKVPLIVNKRTNQLSTYINKVQVPESTWKKDDGSRAKKLIFEVKGVEW